MDVHSRIDQLRATLQSFLAAEGDDGTQAAAQQLSLELSALQAVLRDPLRRRTRDSSVRYAIERSCLALLCCILCRLPVPGPAAGSSSTETVAV